MFNIKQTTFGIFIVFCQLTGHLMIEKKTQFTKYVLLEENFFNKKQTWKKQKKSKFQNNNN